MRELQETILYIAYNLANQNQVITIEAIQQQLEWMLIKDLEIGREMFWLTENGFLIMSSNKEFSLSDFGKREAFRINKVRIREDFTRLMNSATNSTAYLDYCEEIYGYRMYLFNMMDKEQLDYLFSAVAISSNDTILDLGCGIGSILNTLVNKYACQGIGIDQLNEPLVRRYSDKIAYIDGDLDELADYHISPTITLAVDSLYFSSDLDRLVRRLKSFPNNRWYLYYSQYIFKKSQKDESLLESDNTRLAAVLRRNEITYRAVDYSTNERTLYENALQILPKYREVLADEGNSHLYETKMRENRSGQEMYDKGLASRYLYIVE
ncbi:MAG: methionine biosynthesis protein MetW [Syntrophomonas sp.]|nr:methionine biosynthesis protein MetW [Syntrophomonas sp.]